MTPARTLSILYTGARPELVCDALSDIAAAIGAPSPPAALEPGRRLELEVSLGEVRGERVTVLITALPPTPTAAFSLVALGVHSVVIVTDRDAATLEASVALTGEVGRALGARGKRLGEDVPWIIELRGSASDVALDQVASALGAPPTRVLDRTSGQGDRMTAVKALSKDMLGRIHRRPDV